MVSFCIELFCVVTLQYQILVRIAIAYFIIEKKESCATALAGHRAAILFNWNLSAHLYKIIPFFRTTNYFSSAHKIKWSEHSVGCDTLHVFFINPLVKIWSIGDAGVVNLVLIGEINARMILYNFCELVTSHAVVKTSKNTKHVYKINFATAVNICRAYLKHGGDETETMLLIQKYLTPVRYNRKYPIPLRPKRNRDFMYRVA